jgi:hypothetical protein
MRILNSISEVVCLISRIFPQKGYHLILEDYCFHCLEKIFVYSNKKPHIINTICPHCNKNLTFSLPSHHYDDY